MCAQIVRTLIAFRDHLMSNSDPPKVPSRRPRLTDGPRASPRVSVAAASLAYCQSPARRRRRHDPVQARLNRCVRGPCRFEPLRLSRRDRTSVRLDSSMTSGRAVAFWPNIAARSVRSTRPPQSSCRFQAGSPIARACAHCSRISLARFMPARLPTASSILRKHSASSAPPTPGAMSRPWRCASRGASPCLFHRASSPGLGQSAGRREVAAQEETAVACAAGDPCG